MKTLQERIDSQRKFIPERKRHEMEDAVKAILDKQMEEKMESIQQSHPAAKSSEKVFEQVVKDLSSNIKLASTLSIRTIKLVSVLIGSPMQLTDKPDKEKDQTDPSLLVILQKINQELGESLGKIDSNLTELEHAW